MKKTWKISGKNLKDLFIEAESYDEALTKARKINRNYTYGQIVKNKGGD